MDRAQARKHHTRKLSAVMFTDMVGYSDLVGRNEPLGLALLAEQRSIVRDILAKHGGREVDTAGDAFFVEFGSALDATNCAVEIQTTLHERNGSQPSERRIMLRIGLHLADVVHVEDQVQGDGVNIAARMEPLARPGSICMSEDVARQVHNKIDLRLVPLGRKHLKNIHLPMSVYSVLMPWEGSADDVRSGGRLRSPRWTNPGVRLHRHLSIGIALLLLSLAGFMSFKWFAGNPGEGGSGEVSSSMVAVLPFTVQGTPDFAYLGKGMVDLLSTKLDGAGVFQAVDPRAIMGIVGQANDGILDPAGANAVAKRLGAGNYVMGNIVEVDGKLRIDAAMYSGDDVGPAAQGTVEGEARSIFDLLDRLAAQLLLSGKGSGSTVERLDALTTTSFPALKSYLQGVSDFRSGRFRSAAEGLTHAVGEDSTFALAWYQLSATAEWLFDPVLALHAVNQARKYGDRLSKRGQSLVEALEAAKSGRNDEAYQLYRDFVTRYPDDVDAWYQLGELVFHAGPMIGVPPQESLVAWKRLLFFEPDQVTALIHMARVAILEGKVARVDSISKIVLALEPGGERNTELRVHLAFNRGDEGAVRDALAGLHEVSDDMLMEVLWSVASFRAGLEPALLVSEEFRDEARPEEVRFTGLVAQAYLRAAAGRFSDAELLLDQAASLGNRDEPLHRAYLVALPFRKPSREDLEEASLRLTAWDPVSAATSAKSSGWYTSHNDIQSELRQYMLGITQALQGNVVEAERRADVLASSKGPARAGSLLSDLALGVRGQVALSAGRRAEAEDLLALTRRHSSYQYAVSSPFFSLARERFLLAGLMADRDEPSEAVRALGFFEGHSVYDLVFAAPSHLQRANLFERLGDHQGELKHLRHFVDWWTNCDEEFIPLLEDAKRRIAMLSDSRSR